MRNKIYRYFLQGMQQFCSWRVRYRVAAFFGLFVAGILFWGAFNTGMAMTNKESFCISCHEMNAYVYQEYKHTVHYNNRTGVRATCPDCHVPKEWGHMFVRKVSATNELFHKIIGSIDTPDKFHNKRLQLAQYVWEDMRSTDSRECRNCHAFVYMDLAKQKLSSQQAHKRAVDKGRTCIDCHMGIAHQVAKDFDKDGSLHARFKREHRPCADCHKDLVQGEGW
jgi:cytochrome c-type protein NapC